MSAQDIAGPWTFLAASDAPWPTGAELASGEGLPGMSPATVPGTVLNSMIVNGTYPDPLYGKIVTDTIPDTLKDTDYWYRTSFDTPPQVSPSLPEPASRQSRRCSAMPRRS